MFLCYNIQTNCPSAITFTVPYCLVLQQMAINLQRYFRPLLSCETADRRTVNLLPLWRFPAVLYYRLLTDFLWITTLLPKYVLHLWGVTLLSGFVLYGFSIWKLSYSMSLFSMDCFSICELSYSMSLFSMDCSIFVSCHTPWVGFLWIVLYLWAILLSEFVLCPCVLYLWPALLLSFPLSVNHSTH